MPPRHTHDARRAGDPGPDPQPIPPDSVEGASAHPGLKMGSIWLGVGLSLLAGAFAGALAWRAFSLKAGVLIFIGLTFVSAALNPVLWAAIFRAFERHVDRHPR